MTQKFQTVKNELIKKLKDLDPRLSYHTINHTLDVLKQAERIAKEEKIEDERDLYLLKLAALYHDSGFLEVYDGHEEMSCKIILMDADHLSINENELQFIQKLIMATKLSNKPHTHLEKILRDADLDYLGRTDFLEIAALLKKELFAYKIITDTSEWNERQLKFLKQHHYYTKSSQKLREPVKQANYQTLL
jgi:uncharacterized protein